MPIKDKVTPQLRNRFLQEIGKTIENGKERGLLICTDREGILSVTKSLEGEKHNIDLKSLKYECPFKIQGEFHTHTYAAEAQKYVEEKTGTKVSLEEAKVVIADIAKKKNRSLSLPSYGDTLGTVILRYTNETLGTTCIGNDIDTDRIECWTTKNGITEDNFDTAFRELNGPDINGRPKEWIEQLFDKETVNLRNSNKK